MLWIGTADIKDQYFEVEQSSRSLFWLSLPNSSGVDWIRLMHAKELGQNYWEDFDKYSVLYARLERVLCPGVHFKMLVFGGNEVYIGSVNHNGVGIGMKAETTRNLETGVLTGDLEIVDRGMNQFDDVWMG